MSKKNCGDLLDRADALDALQGYSTGGNGSVESYAIGTARLGLDTASIGDGARGLLADELVLTLSDIGNPSVQLQVGNVIGPRRLVDELQAALGDVTHCENNGLKLRIQSKEDSTFFTLTLSKVVLTATGSTITSGLISGEPMAVTENLCFLAADYAVLAGDRGKADS